MKLELEARRNAEVRAGAAEAPEQLGLFVRACPHEAPVGGHELDRAKAVDGEPEPPLEPTEAATERQSGDARMADDTHRADEPMRVACRVELAEERPAAGASEAPRRVDADLVHPPKVDDQAAVGCRVPDGAVTTAADGDLEVALAAESDGGDDVVDVRRSDDQGRPAIEHRVPDPPGIVVIGGIGRDDLAREGSAQLVNLSARWRRGRCIRHAGSLVHSGPYERVDDLRCKTG